MSVFEDIDAELKKLEIVGWQRSVALSLAQALDEKTNASMASELRSLMNSVGSRVVGKQAVKVNDELKSKREERRAAQSRSAASS